MCGRSLFIFFAAVEKKGLFVFLLEEDQVPVLRTEAELLLCTGNAPSSLLFESCLAS